MPGKTHPALPAHTPGDFGVSGAKGWHPPPRPRQLLCSCPMPPKSRLFLILPQEPKEAKEKEAKDREEKEEQAGSRAATHTVRGTVPTPKTGPAQPNTGTQQHPQTLPGCNKEGQTHGGCVEDHSL